ncbi:hypothetical protein [Nocardia abscessus]|uniref:hypothetical protein n=1 Tax=Nocardia abscessus TaxID=120957 RepID=UPI0024569FF6|nr:hypothetical protein [Nocardia abscessus]
MVTELNQDPEDWRRLRDVNHGMAPAFHEHAKNDPDYEVNFYPEKGYAAHAFLEIAARPYRRARTLGWTKVADTTQGRGDVSHSTANSVEDTDIEGGASVRRATPEV